MKQQPVASAMAMAMAMAPPGFQPFHSARPDPAVVSAARKGDRQALEKALHRSRGAAAEQDQHGLTALHAVAESNNKELAEVLAWHFRHNGLDNTIRDNRGRTPLFLASELGSKEVFYTLEWHTSDAGVNIPDHSGATPLMAASANGHCDIVWKLLDRHGICVNDADRFGSTALMKACKGGHTKIALRLIRAGSAVDSEDQYGVTPLHLACEFCDLELVKALHRSGANIQARNVRGLGAVHVASTTVVKSYLEKELRRNGLYREQFVVPLAKQPLLGPHGLVLRAVDLWRGSPVVLKFFKAEEDRARMLDTILTLDEDFVASVPADTSGQLEKYSFEDFESYPECPYCLVLYAGARSLEEMLARPSSLKPKMPTHEVINIIRSVAECVEHLHMSRVVHCNLKPMNFMQFPDGHFRLVGLDFASLIGDVHEAHTTTLETCPPEVAKAWLRQSPLEVSPTRDAWAVGCILYELVFGQKMLEDVLEQSEAAALWGSPKESISEFDRVLQILSLLQQDQISSLVSPRRILESGTAHLQRTPDLVQKLEATAQALERKQTAAAAETTAADGDGSQHAADLPQAGGGNKIIIKRSARGQVVSAVAVGATVGDQRLWEDALLGLSDVLSKLLRVDSYSRSSISDILQSPLLSVEVADEAGIVGDIKSMKRKGLRNQTQLLGKIQEVSMHLEDLVAAVSERGSSTHGSVSSAGSGWSSRRSSAASKGQRPSKLPPILSGNAFSPDSGGTEPFRARSSSLSPVGTSSSGAPEPCPPSSKPAAKPAAFGTSAKYSYPADAGKGGLLAGKATNKLSKLFKRKNKYQISDPGHSGSRSASESGDPVGF
eukprot:CAMPEP_0117663000 /NCGR_PEP_ID=MMETSP0804-20121206/8350_1 /TAXON_ID=1074897 /ORGANISM="Tetraselmis astigmatica, Strain CCMP880" /LENGTH=835 /DNA_ID=CAMNT_0005469931 /DNA_START=166 /DNA_END=2673 /DNA_ORIENTATION=-